MKKTELIVDTIYHLKNGLAGLKVCVLKSNRNNTAKNKKMMEGCLETEMQQPGIFADATLAKEAGYTLIDTEDNHIVSDDEVNDYLVILDGNTRFHAWQLAIEAKTPFTYIFQFKVYKDAEAFKKTYQNINVFNTPTSTADFARDFAATTDNAVISSYRKKQHDGLYPKAAGLATIGREILKADIRKLQEGNVPSGFDDTASHSHYASVYEAALPAINATPGIFKGTEVWKFNAEKIKAATDKASMVRRLCQLYSAIPYIVGKELEKAKKTGTKSKEAVVAEILEAALAKIA